MNDTERFLLEAWDLYHYQPFIISQVSHVIICCASIAVVFRGLFYEKHNHLMESRKYSVIVLYGSFGLHAIIKLTNNLIQLFVAFTATSPESCVFRCSTCVWLRYPLQIAITTGYFVIVINVLELIFASINTKVFYSIICNLYYLSIEDFDELQVTCTSLGTPVQKIVTGHFKFFGALHIFQLLAFSSLYVSSLLKLKRRDFDLTESFRLKQQMNALRIFVPLFSLHMFCSIVFAGFNIYMRPRAHLFTQTEYRTIFEIGYLMGYFNLIAPILLMVMNRQMQRQRRKQKKSMTIPVANEAEVYFELLKKDWKFT